MSRLTAAIIFLLIGATSVRADERPVVAEASPYVVDGGIVCDVRCCGIFSRTLNGLKAGRSRKPLEELETISTPW